MNKTKFTYFLVVVILVILLVFLVPKLLEKTDASGSTIPNAVSEDREKTAAELFGKNISEGEYIEKVFPDLYSNMTSEEKIALSRKPMNWPNL
jgi:hypothetical protein